MNRYERLPEPEEESKQATEESELSNTVQELKDKGYLLEPDELGSNLPPRGFEVFTLYGKDEYIFDPDKIELEVLEMWDADENSIITVVDRDFVVLKRIIDEARPEDNAVILARPKPYATCKKINGVDFEEAANGTKILQAGNLKAQFDEVDDATVSIHIFRDSGSLDYYSRNPQVASSKFVVEIKSILRQLKEFGYQTIVAKPTDERRAKIYKMAGMTDDPNDDRFLIGNIEEILKPRAPRKAA